MHLKKFTHSRKTRKSQQHERNQHEEQDATTPEEKRGRRKLGNKSSGRTRVRVLSSSPTRSSLVRLVAGCGEVLRSSSSSHDHRFLVGVDGAPLRLQVQPLVLKDTNQIQKGKTTTNVQTLPKCTIQWFQQNNARGLVKQDGNRVITKLPDASSSSRDENRRSIPKVSRP